MTSMNGSCIRGMVCLIDVLELGFRRGFMLTRDVDAPADVIESDSNFLSGEKPVLKTASPANK